MIKARTDMTCIRINDREYSQANPASRVEPLCFNKNLIALLWLKYLPYFFPLFRLFECCFLFSSSFFSYVLRCCLVEKASMWRRSNYRNRAWSSAFGISMVASSRMILSAGSSCPPKSHQVPYSKSVKKLRRDCGNSFNLRSASSPFDLLSIKLCTFFFFFAFFPTRLTRLAVSPSCLVPAATRP